MKYLPLLFIVIIACRVKKENTSTDINRLHDIWALTHIDSKSYLTENNVKHPTLELYVADKRLLGNNGCNRLIGSLEILTPTDLKFGPLAGTKMMCQNMELSNQFNANLARVRSYKVEVLQLFMYDEDGTELLVFKKVD